MTEVIEPNDGSGDPDPVRRDALRPDPVPGAEDVEVLLAAAREACVVALRVAVIAEVHEEHGEARAVEHARRDEHVRLAPAGLDAVDDDDRGSLGIVGGDPPAGEPRHPRSAGHARRSVTSSGTGIRLASAIAWSKLRTDRVVVGRVRDVLVVAGPGCGSDAVVDDVADRAIADDHDEQCQDGADRQPPPAATATVRGVGLGRCALSPSVPSVWRAPVERHDDPAPGGDKCQSSLAGRDASGALPLRHDRRSPRPASAPRRRERRRARRGGPVAAALAPARLREPVAAGLPRRGGPPGREPRHLRRRQLPDAGRGRGRRGRRRADPPRRASTATRSTSTAGRSPRAASTRASRWRTAPGASCARRRATRRRHGASCAGSRSRTP